MGKSLKSLIRRMGLALLIGVFFIAALLIQGWLADQAARFQAQERLAADLQRQVSLLREEREELEDEYERQLTLVEDWLGKVAIPRETILQNARRDAIAGNQVALEKCFAVATLEREGWNVSCRFDPSVADPSIIFYVIDPLTGKILSKRVVKGADRKP